MFDGDKDRVQKDKNDDEPVERLTFHKATNAKPANTSIHVYNYMLFICSYALYKNIQRKETECSQHIHELDFGREGS